MKNITLLMSPMTVNTKHNVENCVNEENRVKHVYKLRNSRLRPFLNVYVQWRVERKADIQQTQSLISPAKRVYMHQ